MIDEEGMHVWERGIGIQNLDEVSGGMGSRFPASQQPPSEPPSYYVAFYIWELHMISSAVPFFFFPILIWQFHSDAPKFPTAVGLLLRP